MRVVLIPSAKLIAKELQTIGKLPPVIYPVTDSKTVFDFIYETYNEEQTKFIIVGYEEDKKITEFIRNKKYKNVDVISLNRVNDIGYSIKYGLSSIINEIDDNDTLTINFADTVVMEKSNYWNKDSFLYNEDYISDEWTFFENDKTGFSNIIDKQIVDENVIKKMPLFVGIFSFSNPKYFYQCLLEEVNKESEVDSLYRALMLYKEKYELEAIKTDNWFDLGHIDKYYNSQLGVRAREFNQIKIDNYRGILSKYSENKEKFKGEIQWYIKIPSEVEYVRPRIFSYSTDYEDMFISMEYYSYHTLHELLLFSDLSKNKWNSIFSMIKFILNDFSRFKVVDENIYSDLEEMYLNKTIDRLNEIKNKNEFRNLFESNIKINNIKYKSLNEIINILRSEIPKKLLNMDYFTIIHGDLCFSNILVDNNFSFVKLIDPRGKFGRFDIYGDYRYELAKLIHSIDGKYDYIIEDLFDLDIDGNEIVYKIRLKEQNFSVYDCLIDCLKEDIEKIREEIEIIEALLFLSMVPLHRDDISRQYVMLATGIQILDRWVDIKC